VLYLKRKWKVLYGRGQETQDRSGRSLESRLGGKIESTTFVEQKENGDFRRNAWVHQGGRWPCRTC